MQIRLFNRQDDKELRALVQAINESQGTAMDLDGKDNDLRNVEGSYFGHDGLFLVAEDEGTIIAFCGARIGTSASNVAGETLEVTRLWSKDGIDPSIVEKLISTVRNHAWQLDFDKVLLGDDLIAI